MLVYLPPLDQEQLGSGFGATGFYTPPPDVGSTGYLADLITLIPADMVVPAYTQGYVTGSADLNVVFYDTNGNSISPFSLSYAVGFVSGDDFSEFHPIGNEERIPAEIRTGRFHPHFQIGDKWVTGNYEILWKYRVSEDSEEETKKTLFEVCSAGIYDHGVSENVGYFDVQATVIVVGD